MDEKPKLRSARFKFLMAIQVVGVIALPAVVAGYSLDWIDQRHKTIDELLGPVRFEPEQRGCTRRLETDPDHNDLVAERRQRKAGPLLRLFGEQGVEEIKYDPPRNRELEERLRELFPEAKIWLCLPRPDTYAPPVVTGNQ